MRRDGTRSTLNVERSTSSGTCPVCSRAIGSVWIPRADGTRVHVTCVPVLMVRELRAAQAPAQSGAPASPEQTGTTMDRIREVPQAPG